MNWINRSIARTGKAGAFFALAISLTGGFAAAQSVPTMWFQNQRLAFTHLAPQKKDFAVALHDPALQSLLTRVGASVAWQPGERYILVTTAEPRIVSFAIGDTRYDAGDVSAQAAFAPYERNGDVYLPLYALAHALYLAPKNDRSDVVFQPQIAIAEIQSQRDIAAFVLHAAMPLQPRKISENGNRIVYDFPGFGSTLERVRKIGASGLREIDVEMGGTTRQPDTRIALLLLPGAHVADGVSGAYHDFSVALSGHGAIARNMPPPPPPAVLQSTSSPAPAQTPAEQPELTPAPAPAPMPAGVTAVEGVQNGDAFDVQIAVSGNATYEWHRLLDDRWYVDIHGARLLSPPGDLTQNAPNVSSLRVHQLSGDTVRIALTLTGQKHVDVTPSDKGLTISVKDVDDELAVRTGGGMVGNGATAYAQASPSASSSPWKYGSTPGAPASSNPRLIVIDPGHGGSDPGALNGGLSEKSITLDISNRLRTILVARGWQVQMTRSTDADAYGPNASDHDELQARVGVANQTGARLFVSVHVNSFVNATPHGTTTYFYKAEDLAFANAVHNRLVSAALGTRDDGVIKNNFYVIVHTAMPAVLVETAFLSNPDDRAVLRSPEFLQKVAQAIADGVGDYAGPPGSSAQNLQR
ncbi:MAG: N-acetylmuramoyl-L-alanine amidase family protein [Candidatus Eremiobacteraeota bacterium]|nr:N-acetylmuramoyl-L-alanine amidase family protein [Candidatus Eremiobacteraeota bacterium]